MPPTFPTFSDVDKNDDAQKTQIPTTSTISATSPATPMNPIVIQMPFHVYSQFENAFSEEEITVNAIKDLSDKQMVKLGIVKIGWQKNIKQAAQRY